MITRSLGPALALAVVLSSACTSDNSPLGPKSPPAGPPPQELLGSAIRLDIDLRAGTATVRDPGTVASSTKAASGPSFALLGRNEIEATVTNLTRSPVGKFAPHRARVRFDLALTNKLHKADLVPATFPALPAGVAQIIAFPFATDLAALFGRKVTPSTDWDGTGARGSGAPHSFFNDAVCAGPTPPSDCVRWEAFGPALGAGATTPAKTVGFDVDPTVTTFTVYVVVAADVRDRAVPASISVSDAAPVFSGHIGGILTSRAIQVSNTGGGVLTGLQATVAYPGGEPTGWLNATLGSTNAPTTLTLAPFIADLAVGTYHATVALESPDAGNSGLLISVTLILQAPAAAAISAVSGDGQVGPAGSTLPSPLVVQVTDIFGNPVAGFTVVWTVTGGGSVSQPSVQTGPDGRASVTRTLGPVAGTQTTLATAEGLAGSPVTFIHTATAVPGRVVIVSGNNQSAPAGSALPASLVVQVLDAANNPVAGRPMSWVVGIGGGMVSPQLAITDAHGRASANWTLGPAPGSNTVSAVVSGSGLVTFSATGT